MTMSKCPKEGEKSIYRLVHEAFLSLISFFMKIVQRVHIYMTHLLLSCELLEREVTFYVQDLVLLKDALKSWLLGFLINTFLKLRLNPKCIYASPIEFALLTN